MPTRHTQGPGKHGYLKGGHPPPEYKIWAAMIQRCCNRRCKEYQYYGGRGIKISPRWLAAAGFPNFLADLGPRPHAGLSLHRLNNDGDYEPRTVVWADRRTQQRHTRANRFLTHGSQAKILAEWAEDRGMKPVTLTARLRRGWSVADAITRPVAARRPYAEWAPRGSTR